MNLNCFLFFLFSICSLASTYAQGYEKMNKSELRESIGVLESRLNLLNVEMGALSNKVVSLNIKRDSLVSVLEKCDISRNEYKVELASIQAKLSESKKELANVNTLYSQKQADYRKLEHKNDELISHLNQIILAQSDSIKELLAQSDSIDVIMAQSTPNEIKVESVVDKVEQRSVTDKNDFLNK